MRWRAIAVVSLILLACAGDREKPSIFLEANDFTLPALSGDTITLSKFKGKVVILDFWATWCPPCRAKIPALVELQEEYRERGLQILGVSIDRDKETLKDFYKEHGINYPVLMDDGEVAKRFGVTAIPTTYIIDREGTLVKKYVGPREKEVFRNDIEPLIGDSKQ